MSGKHETTRRQGVNGLVTVVTRSIAARLTPEEIHRVLLDLREKMQTPDPDNPNLWSTQVGEQKIWGILDCGVGPGGADVLTIMFPSDY